MAYSKYYLAATKKKGTRIDKIKDAFFRYTALCFAFLAVLILFRIFEFSFLAFSGKLPAGGFGLFFQSLLYDLKPWLFVSGCLIIPYILASLISKRFADIFFYIVIGLILILYISLISYFSIALTPLGADFYGYSWADIKTTARASGSLNLKTILPIILMLVAVVFVIKLLQKISYNKIIVYAFSIICLGSLFFINMPSLIPKSGNYKNELAYYVVSNKLAYFGSKSYLNFSGNDIKTDQGAFYADGSTENFEYVDPAFPFLRKEKKSDVLSPFLTKDPSKPDFVFVVIEGLGRAFSGPNTPFGSYTPFLDSLRMSSLYWENFTSTSGRTFAILPSLLGSLPFYKNGFNDAPKMPDHFSLLNVLKKNAYHTAYYYGGEAAFDNMQKFLEKNNTNTIIGSEQFEKSYTRLPSKANGFSWGFGDIELYDKSINIIKTSPSPAVHVILTVSTHDPFLIANQAIYEKQAAEKINSLTLTQELKKTHLGYIKQYSTILYADDALRKFFTEYAKLPKFRNTIFIITGDHQMPEIPIGTRLARFHVPLMIYSPLLKRAASFKGICSQFDITPSILNFMGNNFKLPMPKLSHWMGSGLDTSRDFRSVKKFPLMRNKNELLDFISGSFFYSEGELFKIAFNMDIEKVNDDKKTREIASQFQSYKQRNASAIDKPSLYPDSLKIYK